jgi:hypothetical protein
VLAVEVVQEAGLWVVVGHNARLNLRAAVASASGVARQPSGPAVAMVYLRQLMAQTIQVELRIRSLVVQSSISCRPQIQRRIPAPSHDVAYHIAVRGQAVPHDEAQHSLVQSW